MDAKWSRGRNGIKRVEGAPMWSAEARFPGKPYDPAVSRATKRKGREAMNGKSLC